MLFNDLIILITFKIYLKKSLQNTKTHSDNSDLHFILHRRCLVFIYLFCLLFWKNHFLRQVNLPHSSFSPLPPRFLPHDDMQPSWFHCRTVRVVVPVQWQHVYPYILTPAVSSVVGTTGALFSRCLLPSAYE